MNKRVPVVAIVGRPNVGKSTLFNRLVGKRKAIVGDRPGVTVDRLETRCLFGECQVLLVDTGGIGESQHGDMQDAIDVQVQAALSVADVVMFTVDARAGCTPVDQNIADKLRRDALPVVLVVNKAENPDLAMDFYALGLGEPHPVSAAHGQGVKELIEHLTDAVARIYEAIPEQEEESPANLIASITVIGRPNVGKSTLINAWLKRERMVVSPVAGTTRDAIDSDLPYNDGVVRLVDTAGQRKHGRISDVIEFVARVKAVQAFRLADVAVMLLDGSEGIVEQDMRLMRLAHDEGCALIVAVNKMDLLSSDEWNYYVERLHYRMRSLTDIPVFRISAKNSKGVWPLLHEAVKAAQCNAFETGTGELNRWLERAQSRQRAPSHDGAAVKMKYVSQISTSPPTLKVFCNRPGDVKTSYLRFLTEDFKKTFSLPAVPVRIVFSGSKNPYVEEGKRKRNDMPKQTRNRK
ncbi:MAG: ribosome biogenesis GTPase Der [Mariprofundaceae bacterium]|nr:ribosome biogenesis GTPase Der [Mariprofundaceae bacterium]